MVQNRPKMVFDLFEHGEAKSISGNISTNEIQQKIIMLVLTFGFVYLWLNIKCDDDNSQSINR